jgi:hypothetical protein
MQALTLLNLCVPAVDSPIATVHAPQSPEAQPSLVPVWAKCSRNKVKMLVSGETSHRWGVPLSRNAIVAMPNSIVIVLTDRSIYVELGTKRPTLQVFDRCTGVAQACLKCQLLGQLIYPLTLLRNTVNDRRIRDS